MLAFKGEEKPVPGAQLPENLENCKALKRGLDSNTAQRRDMCNTTSRPAPRRAEGGWLKSSFSNGSGACLEVLFDSRTVSIRDSKYRRIPANDPSAEPIITIPIDAWTTFLDETRRITPANRNGALSAEHAADGTTTLRSVADGTVLVYTPAEWSAYVAGVHANEFDRVAILAQASEAAAHPNGFLNELGASTGWLQPAP